MKTKNQLIPYLFTLLIGVLILSSCNQEVENRLISDYPNPNSSIVSKYNKVLYINIENLPGTVVKDLVEKNSMPQLTALLRKSMYTYNGIAEAQEGSEFTRTSGLANLMTGVLTSKHGVLTSYSTYARDNYPSILKLFHENRPEGKTSFYTTIAANADAFVADETEVYTNSSEIELEQILLENIENTEDHVVVVNFSQLSDILSSNGGDYEAPAYLERLVQYDILLGKIKKALDTRISASNEDWIIMLSSTNGGKQRGTIATLYDDESRNTFAMIYNTKFTSKYYPRPTGNVAYADSAIRLIGAQSRGAISDVTKYNFGSYGNYTVQLLINGGTTPYNYPSFISKRKQIFDESTGWTIFGAGANWEFRSANWSFKAGGAIRDGKWHVLTVVFDGNNKEIRLYQDGVKSASGTMTDKNVNNDAPLSIGQIGTDYNSASNEVLMNNIQIYNRAFSDQDVQAVYCQTDISNSHPFYSSLIGYWKANEFGSSIIKERLGTGNDLVMSGPYVWNTFNVISENLCPPVNASYYKNVINSVDLPFMMFSWLGIPIGKNWKWDGHALPLPYDVLTK